MTQSWPSIKKCNGRALISQLWPSNTMARERDSCGGRHGGVCVEKKLRDGTQPHAREPRREQGLRALPGPTELPPEHAKSRQQEVRERQVRDASCACCSGDHDAGEQLERHQWSKTANTLARGRRRGRRRTRTRPRAFLAKPDMGGGSTLPRPERTRHYRRHGEVTRRQTNL
jgi:hypothetical protein